MERMENYQNFQKILKNLKNTVFLSNESDLSVGNFLFCAIINNVENFYLKTC